MINRILIFLLAGCGCLAYFTSCRGIHDHDEQEIKTVVPVTVASPRFGKMAEYTELMATSAFLVKTVIRSPVTGYVEKCSVSPGDRVLKNQLLFRVRTKEAAALQQDSLSSMNISGIVSMKAAQDGTVSVVDHLQGDYVQEGDALCALVEPRSLVFLMEVPFEMNKLIRTGEVSKVVLPDHSEIDVFVRSILPSMSGASQTQRVVLQPRTARNIPENLVATVKIRKDVKLDAQILPKNCILNDEIMQNFWVMKLINDSMALKVPVRLGVRGTDSIEVVTPRFSVGDRILDSGNYGLGDTVFVRVGMHE